MWAVEKDPALRSDFCNLTILESPPDAERLRNTMARAVAAIPRLAQRVVGAPLRMVPPAFADDPTFDLSAHVRRMALPGDGSDRALLDLCGSLAEQPLDRARPLWEFTVIEGLDTVAPRCSKRCITRSPTGSAGSSSPSRSSTSIPTRDRRRYPRSTTKSAPDHDAPHDTPMNVTRRALADLAARNGRVAAALVGGTGRVLTHPTGLPVRVIDAVRLLRSLQRQLLSTEPARSDVMRARSLTPVLRDVLRVAARSAERGQDAGWQRQRPVHRRTARRARPLSRAPRQRGRRAPARDADQHPQPGRRGRQPLRPRATLGTDSARRRSPGAVHRREDPLGRGQKRGRDRRGREPRGVADRAAYVVPRRDARARRAPPTSPPPICAAARCRSTSPARASSRASGTDRAPVPRSTPRS